MGKFDGVLIATDLDGTLLTSKREISDVNLEALNYFTENGGRFTVSTGRSLAAAEFCVPHLPINAPAVLMNGAVIYDYANKSLMHMTGMTRDVYDLVKDTAQKFPEVGVEIFLFDKIYICQPSEVTRMHFEMLKVPFYNSTIDDIEAPEHWCKVNFTQDFEYLNGVRKYLRTYSDNYSMSSSAPYFYEVTNKDDNKGASVFRVAKEIGISTEHIYTIGDNFNDLTMLKMSKCAFAPANAEPEILAAADVVTGSNDEHALRDVVTYLDKIY